MPVYMEPGHVLKGDRIFAQARRIDKPQEIEEVHARQTKLLKSTVLTGSAFCVIEKPLRTSVKT